MFKVTFKEEAGLTKIVWWESDLESGELVVVEFSPQRELRTPRFPPTDRH